jgi:hypothetical protein
MPRHLLHLLAGLLMSLAASGNPDLARNIISSAPDDPSQPVSVPAVVRAALDGRVDAGIVYYSAAVAAGPDISIIPYLAPVNMSEEIRTDGYLAIPEGPGLAVRLDPEKLARFTPDPAALFTR